MTESPNPYESALVQTEAIVSSAPTSTSLGKPRATLVGVFVATLSAAVFGEVLSIVALIPPLNHWLDIDGEFAGLIVIGMPMLAGGCGAVAGVALGLMYPSPWSRWAAAIAGALPALLYLYNGYRPQDPADGIFTVVGIMILSTVAGAIFTARMLISIERRRASQTPTIQTARTGLFVTVIAAVLAAASLIVDVWLWESLDSKSVLGLEFRLVGTFGVGLLAVATNVYVWAAYPNRKRVAMIMGLLSFTGCFAVLSLWFLRLI